MNPFVKHSVLSAFKRFEHIEEKREKKNLLKAHVYLDALFTLYRLKSQLSKPIEVLATDFFKGLNIDALRAILEKFTEVQQVNRGELRGKKQLEAADLPDVKFVCTKELERSLLCSIIGVSVHLAMNQRLKASVLCRHLKKNIGDLKNFFREVGLNMEAIKDTKGEADMMLYVPQPKLRKNEAPQGVGSKRERAKSAEEH